MEKTEYLQQTAETWWSPNTAFWSDDEEEDEEEAGDDNICVIKDQALITHCIRVNKTGFRWEWWLALEINRRASGSRSLEKSDVTLFRKKRED